MNWYLVSMLLGVAVGFTGGYMFFSARLEVQAAEHHGVKKDLQAEISRLRAQVARIIGTEQPKAQLTLVTTDGAKLKLAA